MTKGSRKPWNGSRRGTLKEKPLPFHRPSIDASDIKAVTDCLKSGWLTTGPRCLEFEEAFAKFVGARYAVAVNSCTAALHLALLALEIRSGEVVTSPITFASAVNVILHAGARPVFADVEPICLTMDPAALERKLWKDSRAIMPVHFAGHPCDIEAIRAIAKKWNIPVIADAAHAVEALRQGAKLGNLGDVVCYSFYANKNMTTAEGGMAVTDNEALAERMRTLRLHGMSRDAWKRYMPGEFRHWEIVEPGWKYNLSDVQAALGLSQLKKVDKWRKQREKLAKLYARELQGMSDVERMVPEPGDTSAWHLYVIRVPAEKRDLVLAGLQERGIGVGVHFRSVHNTGYYRTISGDSCPLAERASEQLLSIPLYPSMTDADVRRVARALREVLE